MQLCHPPAQAGSGPMLPQALLTEKSAKDGHEEFSISLTCETTSRVVCLALDCPVQEKTVMFWSVSSRGPPRWLRGLEHRT